MVSEADKYFRKACELNGISGCLALTRHALQGGLQVTAPAPADWLLKACRSGSDGACHLLVTARRCDAGDAVACDLAGRHFSKILNYLAPLDEAPSDPDRHYQNANIDLTGWIRHGYAIVVSDVIMMNESGKWPYGLIMDAPDRAEIYFRKSCDAGFSPACRHLGWQLVAQSQHPELWPAAETLLRADCQNGWANACVARDLLACSSTSSRSCTAAADTVELLFRQKERAFRLRDMACSAGEPVACYELTVTTSTRLKLNNDCLTEYLKLRKPQIYNDCREKFSDFCRTKKTPANHGNLTQAQALACDHYLNSWYCPLFHYDEHHDDEQKQLLNQSCQEGIATACKAAAMTNYYDFPVMRDNFTKACELGDASACATAAWEWRSGRAGTPDATKAADLLDMGCSRGSINACLNQASDMKQGLNGKPDPTAADRVSDQTCEMGNSLACTDRVLKQACENNDPLGCAIAAVRAVPPGRQALADRACVLGEPLGCFVSMPGASDHYPVKESIDQAKLQKLCRSGIAAACLHLLPRVYSGLAIAPFKKPRK